MIAEVIFTGTELLLGQILNTNAQYLQQALASHGFDLYHQVTVGDNLSRCAEAIRQAAGRADLIFVGGGLGPTEDDVSREALSEALSVSLVQDPTALAIVRRFYLARDVPMPGSNLKQALIPVGGTALDNPIGTAPGIVLEHSGKTFFLLPGPPAEFNRMLDEQVLPYLCRRFSGQIGTIYSRVLKVCGIGESALVEKLGDLLNSSSPTVAPCAKEGVIHLRITAKATGEKRPCLPWWAACWFRPACGYLWWRLLPADSWPTCLRATPTPGRPWPAGWSCPRIQPVRCRLRDGFLPVMLN